MVFTVAAVIAVYEMSNMIYKKTEKNIFAAPAYVFAALCFPIASFPAALAAGMSAATAMMLLGALCLMLIAAERVFNKLRTTEESIYSPRFMLIYPMSLFGMLALIMPADGLDIAQKRGSAAGIHMPAHGRHAGLLHRLLHGQSESFAPR